MKQTKFYLYASVVTIAIVTSLLTYGLISKIDQRHNSKINAYIPSQYTGYSNTAGLRGMVDFTGAAAAVTPGVVHIKTTYDRQPAMSYNPFADLFGNDFWNNQRLYQNMPKPEGSGSGVIISDDGYIVTNNHVVENANEVEVVLFDKRTIKAKVIGSDPSTDLALLKVEEKGLPFIYFGNSDSVKVGQWALAVGNPFNLENTVTAGIISAKGRNIGVIKNQNSNNAPIEAFLQTDAAVNPGNSGGALVNTNGELIGINSAIATPTGAFAGYSFAIPVNIVKKVIDDITKYGVVQRAFLGIQTAEMTSELAEKSGAKNLKGIYAAKVNAASAAAEAGLQDGDIITKIDETAITTVPELLEVLGKKRPGDVVKINYVRSGKELKATAKLKNQSGSTEIVSKEDLNAKSFIQLGAEFVPITDKEMQRYDLDGGLKVSKITDGKLARTGMPEGFIITRANKQKVTTENDLKEAIASSKGTLSLEGIYPGYPGKYFYSITGN